MYTYSKPCVALARPEYNNEAQGEGEATVSCWTDVEVAKKTFRHVIVLQELQEKRETACCGRPLHGRYKDAAIELQQSACLMRVVHDHSVNTPRPVLLQQLLRQYGALYGPEVSLIGSDAISVRPHHNKGDA